MLISVRSSVCSFDENLSRAHNLHLSASDSSGRLQVLGLSNVSLMSFEALSLSFVCKSEPKILRLVKVLRAEPELDNRSH